MPDYFFQTPPISPNLSEAELQHWAEQFFPRPRALQELPLILVLPPRERLRNPTAWRQRQSLIQTATQQWLQAARLDDERLRIERRLLPYTPIYIPDTPVGQEYFKLAKAIGDIPLTAPIVPKNQNQGYWLKTLHYHWQARGVVLAQQLLGVLSDPLAAGGVLKERLSDKNLAYLRLTRAIDVACVNLLTQGEPWLKQWAAKEQIAYPFATPVALFLELLEAEFRVTWAQGPLNLEQKPLSKAHQRDEVAVLVRLLKQSPWLEKTGKRQDYASTNTAYLAYLQGASWSGNWLLALRPHGEASQLEAAWTSYVQALSQGKELGVDSLDWLNGEPWNRPVSNALRRVEGTLDGLGYIHWSYT
jgi:hypothetical protein